VIAKGVETPEQMQELQAVGYRFAQGFFIGEPVGAESVGGLLQAAPHTDPAYAGQPGAAGNLPGVAAGQAASPPAPGAARPLGPQN
jgi:predicted signal transduction protein with EAL and GGDEF domain